MIKKIPKCLAQHVKKKAPLDVSFQLLMTRTSIIFRINFEAKVVKESEWLILLS